MDTIKRIIRTAKRELKRTIYREKILWSKNDISCFKKNIDDYLSFEKKIAEEDLIETKKELECLRK